MILTNTSMKVIGIGSRYLMPDESMEITEKQSKLSAIRTYERLGLVKIEEGSSSADFEATVEAEVKRRMEEAASAEEKGEEKEEKEAEEPKKKSKKSAGSKAKEEAEPKEQAVEESGTAE